jgi:hypothetical protein
MSVLAGNFGRGMCNQLQVEVRSGSHQLQACPFSSWRWGGPGPSRPNWVFSWTLATVFVWVTGKWILTAVTGAPCRIKAVLVLFVGPSIHVLASDSPEVCCFGSWLCFPWFYAQMHLHTFLDQHLWNLLDNGPILMLVRVCISILCKIWHSSLIFDDRQHPAARTLKPRTWATKTPNSITRTPEKQCGGGEGGEERKRGWASC